MNRFLVLVCLLSACAPRTIQVKTAPQVAAEVSLRVENRLDDAVNIYMTRDGSQWNLIAQVSRGTTQVLPLRGIPKGTQVSLRATRADGAMSYRRDKVVLEGLTDWVLP